MIKTISKIDNIKNLLEQEAHYQELLFCRGYITTSRKTEDLLIYPFYKNCRQVDNGDDLITFTFYQ
jgi:hypothetical protein